MAATLNEVALVGSAVRVYCGHMGLARADIDAFELCVVEAANNVVRHGYPTGGGRIEVELFCEQGQVCGRLRDHGRSIPAQHWQAAAASAPDVLSQQSADEPRESGYGLALIHHCSDRVDYCPGEEANCLLICKNLTSSRHAVLMADDS